MLVLSYNDEAWVDLESLEEMCSHHERVTTFAFDSKRYVGAQIGIYNPRGQKVGSVSRLRNLEYLVVAGPDDDVRRVTAQVRGDAPSTEPAVAVQR